MENTVELMSDEKLGFGFLPQDEYQMRYLVAGEDNIFRHLTTAEIETLERNLCHADNWSNVLVKNEFNPEAVRNSQFFGKVRIGNIPKGVLRFHDLVIPTGITNSRIVSSDIGDNCAIHDVLYLSHYIVDNNCILHSINEMQTTNHAKFGNGIVKEGEDPSVRVLMALMNESEGRSVAPFEDLICADAMLWGTYREDQELMDSLLQLTDNSYSCKRGWYGEVGKGSVIKGCKIIKDVRFGEGCYVKGCNKLKNLTIHSSATSPTQLGEGIEMVNGIVGPGCHVFYGCKAIRFVMCENSNLKYGARLINSVLGDNSTVSCCEVLSNLVFPFHEQHHNNSFLIASLVMGQSNMAAGANIGSNHNSRGADGEMTAGRGFWPALSSTIKFDSRFASFVLITKGNYPYELNVKPPFSLLSDNPSEGRREIMPGYWWMYNMYALERNFNKFASRDKRKFAIQHIETDYLAPDTAWEILNGIRLLSKWTAISCGYDPSETDLVKRGYEILTTEQSELSGQNVFATGVENSTSRVRVLKPVEALNSYLDMLYYYATKEIGSYCSSNGCTFRELESCAHLASEKWVNLGGQLVPQEKVDDLKARIKNGEFQSWKELHLVYDKWWEEYPHDKALNAVLVLHKLLETEFVSLEQWEELKIRLAKTRNYIEEQVLMTKNKDYHNKFRMSTYRSKEERDAVVGKLEDNSFIAKTKALTEKILKAVNETLY